MELIKRRDHAGKPITHRQNSTYMTQNFCSLSRYLWNAKNRSIRALRFRTCFGHSLHHCSRRPVLEAISRCQIWLSIKGAVMWNSQIGDGWRRWREHTTNNWQNASSGSTVHQRWPCASRTTSSFWVSRRGNISLARPSTEWKHRSFVPRFCTMSTNGLERFMSSIKGVTHISGSFWMSETAAIGMPKLDAGPQKSVLHQYSTVDLED